MKKSIRKKNKRCRSKNSNTLDSVDTLSAYGPVRLGNHVDFNLEREAIQDILDAVVRLQTYIAMRERRQ